jgi:uncharacterized membrane protein
MKMVLGVFEEQDNAESAINRLQDDGFNPKDISIVMKDKDLARDVAANTGANVAAGAASGATTGGILGGIAGLLIGIGAITVPGIGALLIGGPIAAALGLTGAAATTVSGALTGALAGGLVGALVSLGVPEHEAREYEERIKEGGILVAVPTDNYDQDRARQILEAEGATQIRSVSDTTRTHRRDETETETSPAYYSEVERKRREDLDED